MLDYSNSDRILAQILIENPNLRPHAIDLVAKQITADFLKTLHDYSDLMRDIADSIKEKPDQASKYQALAEVAVSIAERLDYIQQGHSDL